MLGGLYPSSKHPAYFLKCWSLKCDIKQFFASIDHDILKNLLSKKIKDKDINWLLNNVIDSFDSDAGENKGIPLGNLTSQIFANIYLNELDQFVKHKLKIKYYLRYADDFLILKTDRKKDDYLNSVKEFLKDILKLELHPKKIDIRELNWGIDFCGYVVLPHYILPRTKTKRRIIKKIGRENLSIQSLKSYLGYLCYANSYILSGEIKNQWFLNLGREQVAEATLDS